jgi:hypothetical protein
MELSKNRTGLMFGLLMAVVHLAWSILVVTGVAKVCFDWILSMHFVSLNYVMLEFNYLHALILLAVALAAGYVIGFIIAGLLNWSKK